MYDFVCIFELYLRDYNIVKRILPFIYLGISLTCIVTFDFKSA